MLSQTDLPRKLCICNDLNYLAHIYLFLRLIDLNYEGQINLVHTSRVPRLPTEQKSCNVG
jgi:hypothetical protein